MKTLIIILIISAFLQTTIFPIDLVLLILICRAYIRPAKSNLYLAFGFGLLVSHLGLTQMGLTSSIYLVVIELTQMLSRWRLAGNPLMIIPISFVFLSVSTLASSGINFVGVDLLKLAIAAAISLPVFYLIRLWEERFIVRKEIKLKI
ncbi:hypothetical protein HYS95_01965 [Candidatus Daviesbacteria bacterium]|nr:hypothetical protein [Candidatus Daviesbacteria bacterium]